MMDQVGYPNVIKDLAAGLLVVRDSQFTVQGDTGSILQMDINGKRGQLKKRSYLRIGFSCIANRIKRVLLSLIDDDQTGFISS